MKSLLHRIRVAWHSRPIVLKMLSFGVIGLGNDFGVFTFAYKVLELPLVASNVKGWLVAVSGSYVMNTTVTFWGRVGPRPEGQRLPALRRFRRPRSGRNYYHARGAVALSACDHDEADLHPRRLCGQFRDVAFHCLPSARAAGGEAGVAAPIQRRPHLGQKSQ
jgi:hypothetical protein